MADPITVISTIATAFDLIERGLKVCSAVVQFFKTWWGADAKIQVFCGSLDFDVALMNTIWVLLEQPEAHLDEPRIIAYVEKCSKALGDIVKEVQDFAQFDNLDAKIKLKEGQRLRYAFHESAKLERMSEAAERLRRHLNLVIDTVTL
jgi:hypothetical protein